MTKGLTINDLVVEHRTSRGTVHAVSDVSLNVPQGQTLGLVGESGCGKSSLARAVTGLNPPTSGQVLIDGEAMLYGRRQATSRRIQMVFQDPYGSLNPRLTVRQQVELPLSVHRIGTRAERRRASEELLERVGISAALFGRLPHQLSGGQRQRVGIARALVLQPDIIICDEPVSALDVSVQAQVLNLLLDLQKERNLCYLFISHDLDVVRYISNHIAVMYLGVIVESGPVETIWSRARHPYTRALISISQDEGEGAEKTDVLKGELPSPLDPPSGCRFRTRCPFAIERCSVESPEPRLFEDRHFVACHRAEEFAVVESSPDAATAPKESMRHG